RRAGGAAPALLSRGDPQLAAPAPPGTEARPAAARQQPGALRRARAHQEGQETLEDLQAPAPCAGAPARGVPEAFGHAQAQPRAVGPSGAGAGQHLPPGADFLSGVAEAVWALGRTQCPWDVRLAPLPSGCECWRAGLRAEHPTGQALAALPLRCGAEETAA